MELKVWVEGIQRIICGVTVSTTCQDVVFALAHATGKVGRFTLIERWRNNERLLAPNENPLKLLLKWGEYANDVQFILQRSESRQQQQQQQQNNNSNDNHNNNNNYNNLNNNHENTAVITNNKPLANNDDDRSDNADAQTLNQTMELSLNTAHERAKELKKAFSASSAILVKPWENVGIVKGVPQSSNLNNNEQHVQQHYSSQQSQPSPSLDFPLVPRHEKSRSNPIELRLSGADGDNNDFLANGAYQETNSITNNNNNNNIYQHLGAHNSKSVNEINLAEVRNALDRGMLRTDLPSKCDNRVNALNLCHEVKKNKIIRLLKCTMAVPLSEEHNLGGSAEIMFPPTAAISNENLLDIFNGNSSQLYKFNNSPDDLYKQATTISANGALVPPPYRDPPPPRNSPLQLNQQSQTQNLTAHLTNVNTNSTESNLSPSMGVMTTKDGQTSSSEGDYDIVDYSRLSDLVIPSNMDESESIFQATQYNDLLQLIKCQREKLNAQQTELNKYDAEILYLETKDHDQTQELEAISREITLVDQLFRQGSEQLQTLQYVEEENELVKQQEKTLKSEIALLRSKLANCETELLQCKNKIRLLMDDIEIEQRSNCKQNKRQMVERDLLMEMERIQSEIDQAIHNTDTSNNTAENLKKEIALIENAIAEKKRQVEQLVNEMKEVNLQSLTVTPSEEIKHFLEGSNKPGSSRRIIGSPRQLENAVPTSKNPHGVWV
ncbi:ras association domain-containing protein 8 isoform 2-T2 [Glossina fuscipes fuscipes]